MDIDFSFESPACTIDLDEKAIEKWIVKIIESEQKEPGNLSFFFCSDNYLLEINQKYLNHDTYTDIITFDYVEGKIISGDILISIERVRENAEKFEVEFESELSRVVSHGILHLLGYKDKSPEEQATMREKEDFCLTLHPSF